MYLKCDQCLHRCSKKQKNLIKKKLLVLPLRSFPPGFVYMAAEMMCPYTHVTEQSLASAAVTWVYGHSTAAVNEA